MIHKDGQYLLQDRVKEETGLTIVNPKLCGVKQFPMDHGRYLVFLFETNQFVGELTNSEEGNMYWIKEEESAKLNLVDDFHDLIEVMLDDKLNEFQYVFDGGLWKVVKK